MSLRVFGVVHLTLAAALGFAQVSYAQTSPSDPQIDAQTLTKLLERLALDEARIKELEGKLGLVIAAAPVQKPVAADTHEESMEAADARATGTAPASDNDAMTGMDAGHTMELPAGGPTLKVRGYLDLNFGAGSFVNPIVFVNDGVSRSGFQAGEMALMVSSQLSPKLSFMSEIVLAADNANAFDLDVERYLLTYKASKYFEASTGRYHTSIGYYSTAYHHGTWFQTATGRPLMYFYEDSGGLLPIHNVGVTVTGLVPGTDSLGLHWIAELGNGRASDKFASQVQNFYTDRNHRAVNLAVYIAPTWARGLQIGGSYYRDRLTPPGLAPDNQTIGSFYAVYLTPTWEFFNEGVLLTNHIENGGRTYNTPLAYTQLSRKFGAWHPYLRYQYINSPDGDPVNVYTGRYMGPSVGARYDFADYAAFKLQYNLLDEHRQKAAYGLDAQVAFTF